MASGCTACIFNYIFNAVKLLWPFNQQAAFWTRRYGSSVPTDTTMQILGKRKDIWIVRVQKDRIAGDMVAFITDTDLYITDLCVQIALQVPALCCSKIKKLQTPRGMASTQVLITSPRMAAAVIERCAPSSWNIFLRLVSSSCKKEGRALRTTTVMLVYPLATSRLKFP